MILSAQRVVAPASGDRAIHCYHYVQQDWMQVGSPLERLAKPGHLVWHHHPLPAQGNRILSFVDVAAPEDVTSDEVADALRQFVELPKLQQAFVPYGSRVGLSVGFDDSTVARWRQETLELLRFLFAVHP
jgi:hypothetical protein